MGANQSLQSQSGASNSHGITVVNPTPGLGSNEEKIILPSRVPPILSVDGHVIDPKRHKPENQLIYQLWIEFASVIDKFSNLRAELVATRQTKLQEKISQVDDHVQEFTDSYINDKHKAFAKMNDDCRKVEDLGKLLQKCETQSEICVNMLNKLNFLLPAEHRLETLEIS